MATSTGALIRADVVTAIEGIATTSLGFDDASGNVKNYLLEEEIPEKVTAYLFANVGNEREVRAIGVQVYEAERFSGVGSTKETGFRDYTIVVELYYGAHGSTPINTMLDHERYIRKVVKDLNLNLNSRVSALLDMGQGLTSIEQIDDAGVPVFVRRCEWQAERYNPDWT